VIDDESIPGPNKRALSLVLSAERNPQKQDFILDFGAEVGRASQAAGH
jgi:hypothetical protein